ncbi:MAG: phage tail protein [Alphaproteobacteria bacterium]|nr:phage tail protein [Alphaproteobacteria bacterium]
MSEFYCIITDVGLSKLARAKVAQENIALTQMAVGDSSGAYYEPNSSQTKLINEKHRFDIARIYIDNINPKQLLIEASVKENIGGFFIREVGVYDDEGDLFAIGKYPVTYKPASDSGSGKDIYMRMALLFSNTPNIALYINPYSAVASIDFVETTLEQLKHSKLKEIQGGGVDEFYHLTSSQHDTAESLDLLKLVSNSGKNLAVNPAGDGFCVVRPDELFQNMIEIPANTIVIKDTHSIYKKVITTATTLAFNITDITTTTQVVTFEIFLDIRTLSTITFPSNVRWLNDTAPAIDSANYFLFAFRSFDKGVTWVGNIQGWWKR